jgi:uncharacterized protein YdhG (YjbR/CyaY superfamily)
VKLFAGLMLRGAAEATPMAKRSNDTPATVASYLAAQPPAARRTLARVRAAIRGALPAADEVLSYGIPAYQQDGRLVLWFAGWKEHWSLYPASGLEQQLGDRLRGRIVSKGTIRFAWSEPVPLALVARIARLRAAFTSRSRSAPARSRRAAR